MPEKWISGALDGESWLHGWNHKNAPSTRRKKIREAIKDAGAPGTPRHKSALSVFRKLLAIANAHRGRNADVVKTAEEDMKFIKRTNAWKRK